MFEPTEREVNMDLLRSMQLFERSRVGPIAAFEPRRPQRLLVVLDGSQQDATSTALARGLQQRFEGTIDVLDAREHAVEDALAAQAAESLGGRALPKTAGDAYEQILRAIEATHCDLAIVPCPFGRDFSEIGAESTGTVVDVLTARSPVPLLIVRDIYTPESTPFDHVVLTPIAEIDATECAAAWAVGMVTSGGAVELLMLLETDVAEQVRNLVQALDPNVEVSQDAVREALERSQIRLHCALEKTAQQIGFVHELAAHPLNDTPFPDLRRYGRLPLLVMGLDRDDRGSFARLHELLRLSPDPVLVTPFESYADSEATSPHHPA